MSEITGNRENAADRTIAERTNTENSAAERSTAGNPTGNPAAERSDAGNPTVGNSAAERLFQRLPARYVIVGGMILLAVLSSLIFSVIFNGTSAAASRIPLFCGKIFTENELIQIEMAFAEAQLADYTIANGTVSVPQHKKNLYLQALRKLPIFEDGKENEPSKAGFWVSDREREQEILHEKQKTLAAQIRTFHGIEDARVLLDVCETKNGFVRQKHASASITIRSVNQYNVSENDIQSILHLVTGAVCGLADSDVAIVDTRTNRSWRIPEKKTADSSVKTEGAASETAAQPTNIVFQSARDGSAAAGKMDAAARTLLQSDSSSFAEDGSISFSSDALVDLTPPEGELVFAPSGIQIGGNAEESVSPTEMSPFTPPVRVVETPVATSGQRPREVSALLALVACSVIVVCGLVIYMTRRTLIPAPEKKSQKRNADSVKSSGAETLTEFNPAETLVGNADGVVARTSLEPNLGSNGAKIEAPEKIEREIETKSNIELESVLESEQKSDLKSNLKSNPEPEEVLPPERTPKEPPRPAIPEIEALQKVEPHDLALALLEERPQTIAMILAQFSEDVVSLVLKEIPNHLRLTIESRLLACSTPDEEILKEAASAIQEHLSVLNSVKDSSSRPAETFQEESKEREKRVEREEKTSAPPMRPRVIRPLADVLPQRVTPMEPETEQKIEQKTEVSAASDSETKMNEKMNEKTETKNETTLGVEVPTLEFEELNVFTDTELRLIFSSCGQRDAILSLLGAEPGFVEAILALLPKAEADQVRRKLSHPGRIRLTEVENARERVLQAARQLMIQGKIQVPEARNATV